MPAKLLQSGPTLCHPKDGSPPGSSVHGILQARMLEWVAISSFRGRSWPRDEGGIFCMSCTGRQVLYHLRQGQVHRNDRQDRLEGIGGNSGDNLCVCWNDASVEYSRLTSRLVLNPQHTAQCASAAAHWREIQAIVHHVLGGQKWRRKELSERPSKRTLGLIIT